MLLFCFAFFFFFPAVSNVDVNSASGRLLLFWAPGSRIIPGFSHANVYFHPGPPFETVAGNHKCQTVLRSMNAPLRNNAEEKKMQLNISAFIYLVRLHL